jgi:hypothetical protein
MRQRAVAAAGPAKPSGLRSRAEGILPVAEEAVLAGDFHGEGRDQALAVDGDAKGGPNASERFGDERRGAGFLEYVISVRPAAGRRTGGGTG